MMTDSCGSQSLLALPPEPSASPPALQLSQNQTLLPQSY